MHFFNVSVYAKLITELNRSLKLWTAPECTKNNDFADIYKYNFYLFILHKKYIQSEIPISRTFKGNET